VKCGRKELKGNIPDHKRESQWTTFDVAIFK